eukprot:322544-Chlamydomonas_euryale.AAC.1
MVGQLAALLAGSMPTDEGGAGSVGDAGASGVGGPRALMHAASGIGGSGVPASAAAAPQPPPPPPPLMEQQQQQQQQHRAGGADEWARGPHDAGFSHHVDRLERPPAGHSGQLDLPLPSGGRAGPSPLGPSQVALHGEWAGGHGPHTAGGGGPAFARFGPMASSGGPMVPMRRPLLHADMSPAPGNGGSGSCALPLPPPPMQRHGPGGHTNGMPMGPGERGGPGMPMGPGERGGPSMQMGPGERGGPGMQM